MLSSPRLLIIQALCFWLPSREEINVLSWTSGRLINALPSSPPHCPIFIWHSICFAKAKYFITLDFYQAYHQIPLAKASKPSTSLWEHPHIIIFSIQYSFHIITPNTHPYTDPDNSCLTISSIQYSVSHHNSEHPSIH